MFETTKQPIDVLGEVTLFSLVKFLDFPHLLQAPDSHQCASTEHQGWHLTIRIAGVLQKWADSGGNALEMEVKFAKIHGSISKNPLFYGSGIHK